MFGGPRNRPFVPGTKVRNANELRCKRAIFSNGRGIPAELFDKMFSVMSRQSERQLGAFLFLHAEEFGEAYQPKTSIVEFRNAVIHKGVIPSPDTAHTFCAAVYNEIYGLFGKIHTKHKDEVRKTVMDELRRRQSKLSQGARISSVAGPSVFGAISATNPSSFKEALNSYRERREMLERAVPRMKRLHRLLSWLPRSR